MFWTFRCQRRESQFAVRACWCLLLLLTISRCRKLDRCSCAVLPRFCGKLSRSTLTHRCRFFPLSNFEPGPRILLLFVQISTTLALFTFYPRSEKRGDWRTLAMWAWADLSCSFGTLIPVWLIGAFAVLFLGSMCTRAFFCRLGSVWGSRDYFPLLLRDYKSDKIWCII